MSASSRGWGFVWFAFAAEALVLAPNIVVVPLARADDAGGAALSGDAAGSEPERSVSEPGTSAAVEPSAEPSLPEAHRPELALRIRPDDGVQTGDLLHVELEVVVPDGDDVNLPRQSFAPFELFDQSHEESVVDGRRRFLFRLDLLALMPGEHTLAPITIRVITADGIVGQVRTDPAPVRVRSLIENEPDAQPRPPTEPVVVMQDDYTLAWVAGALALMGLSALLTWLALRWWRSRPVAAPPPPPPRPAHEVALDKLRALRRELPVALADGTQARIVDGASDVLREYLGHRFGFQGLESTTDEVIARMRQQRMNGVTLPEIVALLGECDLVKFAKAVPAEADCNRVIDEVERVVTRTMHEFVSAIVPPAPTPTTVRAPAGAPAVAPFEAVPRTGAVEVSEQAIPGTRPPPAPASLGPTEPPAFAIPATPVPPPPPRDSSEEPASAEQVWQRLDEAVSEDRLVVGEVVARRDDGLVVALGGGVDALLPEAQWEGLDPEAALGQILAFRVVSLNAARGRVVLSRRGVDPSSERALLGRSTPIGFADPGGGPT